MKTFKNVFILIFPLLILSVLIQRANDNHRTLRETYDYMKTSYKLIAENYKEDILENTNVLKNFNFELPTEEDRQDNNFLENIWLYIKWFGNVLYQMFTALLVVLSCLFNTLVLILNAIYTFVSVIFYLSGF